MMAALRDRLANLLGAHAGGLSRAGIAVMGVRIGAAGLALVAQVVAARAVGASAFGSYALALVWLLLLGHGSTMGTNQLVCRFLAVYRVEGDRGAALGLLRFSLTLALGASLIVALLAVGLVRMLGLPADMVALATLAFLAVPLLTMQDFLEAIARGLDTPLRGIGPALLLRHLAIIFGVAGVFVFGGAAGAATIMGFTIAGLVLAVSVQYVLLRRALASAVGGALPSYKARYWFRTALPIAVLDASETLFSNADILILGLFVPPDIVAFYFAATRLAQMLSYIPYGTTAATAQKYAALAARRQVGELRSLAGSVTLVSTLIAGGGALVLWAAAPLLLSLFGEGYDAAAGIVPLLSLGIVLMCALGPGEDILTMLGEEKACALGFAVALVLNIGLNFALIPAFGMAGAAVASMTALAVRGGMLAYFAHARLGIVLPIGLGWLTNAGQGRAAA